jgi:hypothetical protein
MRPSRCAARFLALARGAGFRSPAGGAAALAVPARSAHPAGVIALAGCLALLALAPSLAAPRPARAADCTISWTAATSGSWSNGTSWTPNRVPTASDDVCITVAGTYTVTLTANASAQSLQVGTGATLSIQSISNTTLTLAADSTNAGAITLRQGAGGCTSAALALTAGTLTNTGTLTLGDACGGAFLTGSLINSGTVVVPSETATLNGAAATYTNTGAFTVNGPLSVTSGTFLQNAGSLTISTTDSFVVASGATLVLSGGTVGTATVLGGGTTAGAPTVRGGALQFGVGSTATGDVAVEETSTLGGDVPAGMRVFINADNLPTSLTSAGGFTNAGTMQLRQTGGGCRSSTLVVSAGTLTNTGTLTLGDACGGAFLTGNLASSGTVNVPAGHAAGLNGSGASYTNTGTFTVGDVLTLTGGSTFHQNGGTLTITGSGSFTAVAGTTFAFGGGATGGTPPLVSSAALQFGAGSTATGTVIVEGTSTLIGDVPAGATVSVDAIGTNSTLTAATGFTNAGTLRLRQTGGSCRSATLALTSGALTNTGTLVLGNACGGAVLDGSLVNSGAVTVPGTHASFLQGAGATFTNTSVGTVTINPSAILRLSGSGAAFSNAGTVTIGAGGQLTGVGTETFTNQGTGTLAFAIASGSSFGRLNLSGMVTLAGMANPVVQSGFVPALGQRFQVITAPHGATCFATVQQGFSADCSNPANVALVAPSTPPAAPSNVRIGATTASSIEVLWNDNAATESRHEVVYSPVATASYTTVVVPGADVTNWTHSGLSANQAFNYWVRACNSAGCSAIVGGVAGATAAASPPAAPGNVHTGTVTNSSIQVLWTDNATTEAWYQLAWSPAGSSTYTYVDLVSNTTSWTHTGLSAGQSFYYWVRVCNGAGCTGWTGGILGTTSGGALPAAPTNVRIGTVTTTSIAVDWNDISTNETAFQVVYTRASPINYVTQVLPANTTSWTHMGLTTGDTYYYWVRACNGTLCSGYAGGVGATAAAVPAVPTGLMVTGSTATSIDIAWTDNASGEGSYQVVWSPTGTPSYTFVDLAANTTSWSHTGLGAGQSYHYWVRACTGLTCSAYAGAVTGSTTGSGSLRAGSRTAATTAAPPSPPARPVTPPPPPPAGGSAPAPTPPSTGRPPTAPPPPAVPAPQPPIRRGR